MKISIHHWRYEDGWRDIPSIFLEKGMPTKEFIECTVGWHCWVYVRDHDEFMYWMEENCPLTKCSPKFNSGDPMIMLHITCKEEAAYFKLNFNT